MIGNEAQPLVVYPEGIKNKYFARRPAVKCKPCFHSPCLTLETLKLLHIMLLLIALSASRSSTVGGMRMKEYVLQYNTLKIQLWSIQMYCHIHIILLNPEIF